MWRSCGSFARGWQALINRDLNGIRTSPLPRQHRDVKVLRTDSMMHRSSGRSLLILNIWRVHGRRLELNARSALCCCSSRAFRQSSLYRRSPYPEPPRYGQQPNPYIQQPFKYAPNEAYPSQIYTQVPPKSRSTLFYAAIALGLFGLGYGTGKVVTVLQYASTSRMLQDINELATETDINETYDLESGLKWRDETLTLHGATNKLRMQGNEFCRNEAYEDLPSFLYRHDSLSLPSNSPCEDFLASSRMPVNIKDGHETLAWNFWGVYDGHAGPLTGDIISWSLVPHVVRELQMVPSSDLKMLNSIEVDKAIKAGFLRLDDAMVFNGLNALRDAKSNPEAIARMQPAQSGSCALVAMFDPQTLNLRVACTGDSRAVLGRCNADFNDQNATWSAIPLSEDQTGFNEAERKRIAVEHPDEPDVIDSATGRLLGFAITRAFGDCRLKWPAAALEDCRERLWGQRPRPNYKSPPYLTAEPVITSTKVQAGDFMILASDGLWDHMSSDDAVKCVEMWIKAKTRDSQFPQPPGETFGEYYQDIDKSVRMEPLPKEWKSTPTDFVVEDSGAATHLVKNALGGARRDHFRSVMSVSAPDSRYIRDDISVHIIFFDGPVRTWLTERDRKAIEKAWSQYSA